MIARLTDEAGQPCRQHEAMPVDRQPGGPVVFDHVVLGQLGDPADQHPEEQDERSPDPKVQGHGLVGEAAAAAAAAARGKKAEAAVAAAGRTRFAR